MTSPVEVRLSREMRLLDVTMIGVGAMIGAGIFVLTGIAAGVAGPALVLAFALNGVVTLFTAMAYAELGSCFHDAGGGYLWVKEGLSGEHWFLRPQAFLSGWMSWFAHAVACSLYALGFGAYFRELLELVGAPVGDAHWVDKVLAVTVIGLFGYINYRGASETGKAGNIVTTAKIAIIGTFIAFGLHVIGVRPEWKASFEPFLPNGIGGVFMAMGLTFIAFEGYEIIAQCSEEVVDPSRNIPRAVFLSLAIVIPIYVLVAFVAVGAVEAPGMASWEYLGLHKETALVEAARQFFRGGGLMILVGGLMSTMSALNATVFSSSRVSFAMGRDHNLPSFFGLVHPERKTPHVAILLSLLVIVVMAVALPIEDVASAADIMFLLLFIQVNFTLVSLRRRRPDLDRGFRTPLVPLFPYAGIVSQLFLAVYMFRYSPSAWASAAVWLGLGALVYRYYAEGHEKAVKARLRVLRKIEEKEYRVLVPLSNPDTLGNLMEVACLLARFHRGSVVGLAVVELFEDEPLARGRALSERMKPILAEAETIATKKGVAFKGLVKISHRISFAIVETVREEECNFVVLGRERRPTLAERFFASVVDRVLREAPCEVAIVQGTIDPPSIEHIFVPVSDSPNSRLAVELLPTFCKEYGAEASLVTVVPRTASDRDVAEYLERLRADVLPSGEDGRLQVVRSGDVVRALLRESRGADLILAGAAAGGFLEQLVFYPPSLALADRVRRPIVLVRKWTTSEAESIATVARGA